MLEQSQRQVQKQTFKLSPAMIQSLEVLSLPSFDLRERIYEESEKNPVLEIVKEPEESALLRKASGKISENQRSFSKTATSDTFQNFLESRPAPEATLQRHLLEQLSEEILPKDVEIIAKRIIQNLNKYGFHIEPPESLFFPAECVDYKLSEKQKEILKNALKVIHNMEPAGIACFNVQESLLLQAERFDEKPFLVKKLLGEDFDLLNNPKVYAIKRKKPSWSEEEIEKALSFIRTLDPYPARQFYSEQTVYAVPDVYVYRNENDAEDFSEMFTVLPAEEYLPVPSVSSEYGESYLNDEKAAEFIKEKVKDAERFINSLEERKKTLVLVVKSIIKFQKSFFLGITSVPGALRLKDVAEDVNRHEATISRIVNGKFLQCEKGLFELKYFFSNAAVSNSQGGSVSKEAVKQKMLLLLNEADEKKEKLSDSKLAQLLAEQGMPIARRTVAKYRSELNISSSFER